MPRPLGAPCQSHAISLNGHRLSSSTNIFVDTLTFVNRPIIGHPKETVDIDAIKLRLPIVKLGEDPTHTV